MAESNPGELDKKIRGLLRRALAHNSSKHAEICDRLTKILNRKISLNMFANWTAEGKREWHLPAYLVPTICELTQDDSIQRLLLSDRSLRHLKVGEFVMEHSQIWRFVERELMRAVFLALYGKKNGARWFRAACRVVAAQNRKWDRERS